MTGDRIGIDYADLTVGDFSTILGCLEYSEEDKSIHLGMLFDRVTSCGKLMGTTILSRKVRITCKDCISELIYRQEHPEAKKKPFGHFTCGEDKEWLKERQKVIAGE